MKHLIFTKDMLIFGLHNKKSSCHNKKAGGVKMSNIELPLGFGMALAQNSAAMERFAMMSEDEKRSVISGTHQVKSKAEMHRYVEQLAER